MEHERGSSADLVAPLPQFPVEDGKAVLEGAPECLFLAGHHLEDEVTVFQQVRIGLAHHVDGRVGERRHDQLVTTQQVGETNRPPQDPTEHIAARLVGGKHPVVDEHRA